MNVPIEIVLEKVGKWMSYADQDLALARHALAMGENCPFHLAAYHAQQCAEKYLKAYLVLRGVDFPHTHNVLHLIELCPPDTPRLSEIDCAATLSPYAISTRYPGEDEPVAEAQAIEAIGIADGVRRVLRQALMEAAQVAHVERMAQRTWPIPDGEWQEKRKDE